MKQVLVALCVVVGCARPSSIECADGRVCPPDTACDDAHQLCVSVEQAEACTGLTDGQPCSFGSLVGVCDLGVCIASGCGNNIVEGDEVCDDGDTMSGDGCTDDCLKIERCGDGVIDEGEACDDANANPADHCDACTAATWRATALIASDADPSKLGLSQPRRVAIDRRGNIYIADQFNHRIRKIDSAGIATTIAGNGTFGTAGDGGPATAAQLALPRGIAVDGLGNVFIADNSHRVRRIDPNGFITTIAGIGGPGSVGDGGPATAANLSSPEDLVVDGLGNIYIADVGNHRIRKVDTAGIITTIAGNGTFGFSGDGGPATSASLNRPNGLAFDANDNLFIADSENHRIRRVQPNGVITTIAGNGQLGYGGDGGAATSALLYQPVDLAFDSLGNLYIADNLNHRIRRIDGAGIITTIAGTSIGNPGSYGGDGGPAVLAQLWSPTGVMFDAAGNLYIADNDNHRIRKIDTAGTITTFAGTGIPHEDEGGAATSAAMQFPTGIAVDAAGNVYIADEGNDDVRRLDGAALITTVAGNGQAGYSGDGGPAIAAQLSGASSLAFDALGNLFIADRSNARIRKVAPDGVITTIAGDGISGSTGDGGPATAARVYLPRALAVDNAGNLYIGEGATGRVRKIDPAGVITTFAGTGTSGFSGDGGPATQAQLSLPMGIAVDGDGNVYMSDANNLRVRRVDQNGIITTIAGNGTFGSAGDGGPATAAQLASPKGLAFDSAGALYIADGNRVRRIGVDGVITTYAGTTSGASGDGGPATAAKLSGITGVAVDSMGRVYVTDTTNKLVRRVDASGIVSIAGQVDPLGVGPLARARLADPRALVIAPSFTLVAAGSSGTVEAIGTSLQPVIGRYLTHTTATGARARYREQSFGRVGGIAFEVQAGIIYLTETGTTNHRLHAVTVTDPAKPLAWTIESLNDGTTGFADGPIASAQFRNPTGLYLDAPARRLYIADTGNHAIRILDLATMTVTTIAGRGAIRGYFGDEGPATSALLHAPQAITRCTNGDVFVADTGNHRVRRIAAGTNTITTVLGDGVASSSGDGAPASSFPVDEPLGLACDAIGNLYVTSSRTIRMVAADDAGRVDGSGPVYTIYGLPPRDTFPASATACLTGIAVVDAATLRVTDACAGMLVELRRESL